MGIVASTGFKNLDDQIDACVKNNKDECKKYPYYNRKYKCKKMCQDKLIDDDVYYDVREDECDNLDKDAKYKCRRMYRMHNYNPTTYQSYKEGGKRHKKGKRNTKRRVYR